MCGIVAILSESADSLDPLDAMLESIRHRGPDEGATYASKPDGLGLGTRRLSILDHVGGKQPIWDELQEHAVVFNGEIYNHHQLRAELIELGHVFKSDHSDTEVLVHGFEQWQSGLFEKLNGMFAVAIWTRADNTLTVARDRFGEKPLYIARIRAGYVIASEIKALFAHPGLDRTLDPAAVAEYLAYDFSLSPKTMLRDVLKLPPAYFATISTSSLAMEPYWEPVLETIDRNESETISTLDSLLDHAVQSRMEADVPVALLLSGGLDSSTVGWYMCKHRSDVDSYSIAFSDPNHDESAYADRVASILGTKHHVELLSPNRVLDEVSDIASVLDEPMADQSVLPTLLLSRTVGRQVKVAVGGDGADELLMGYRTFFLLKTFAAVDRLAPYLRKLPAVAWARDRSAFAGPRSRAVWQAIGTLGRTPRGRLLAWRGSFSGAGGELLTHRVRSTPPPRNQYRRPVSRGSRSLGHDQDIVAAYLQTYLPEDILVKVDRASMACSLEVRAPFLDPVLGSFLLSVPPRMKRRGLNGKILLKKLMRGRLPDDIVFRSKHGFSVPMSEWLRGPLQPLLQDTLSGMSVIRDQLLDASIVRGLVKSHVEGRVDYSRQLWNLMLLAMWQRRWQVTLPD